MYNRRYNNQYYNQFNRRYNNQYYDQYNNDERFGFLGPFILGGIAGTLAAPLVYGGRPYYYNNYYYPPYYYPPYYYRPY